MAGASERPPRPARLTRFRAAALSAGAASAVLGVLFWAGLHPDRVLLGLPAAAAIAALTFLTKPWYERMFARLWERESFRGELSDLGRHFRANIQVIETIEAHHGERRPRSIHFARMAILPDSALLDDGTFKHLPRGLMADTYRFKLFLRNLELDVKEAVRIAESGDHADLLAFLPFLKGRYRRGVSAAAELLDKFGDPPTDREPTLRSLDPTEISYYPAGTAITGA